MKRFQWKWIFTGSNTCCTIWRPFCFAMAAILNPKWPPKYKYPPIWAKFGFQVDYDVANWYPLFGSHVMILQIISYLVITSPLLMSGDVLLFYVSFSLLLHHPDCCRVMCCYSTFLFHYYSYYSFSSTHFCPLDFSEVPWSNFMKPCRNIICHVKLCF